MKAYEVYLLCFERIFSKPLPVPSYRRFKFSEIFSTKILQPNSKTRADSGKL